MGSATALITFTSGGGGAGGCVLALQAASATATIITAPKTRALRQALYKRFFLTKYLPLLLLVRPMKSRLSCHTVQRETRVHMILRST
jgi:hypothetical protein